MLRKCKNSHLTASTDISHSCILLTLNTDKAWKSHVCYTCVYVVVKARKRNINQNSDGTKKSFTIRENACTHVYLSGNLEFSRSSVVPISDGCCLIFSNNFRNCYEHINYVTHVRFWVLTAVNMKMFVFWDVAACSLIKVY